MRYEQALQLVFKRRNCEKYSKEANANWPPCCNECGCVAEANQLMQPLVAKPAEEA